MPYDLIKITFTKKKKKKKKKKKIKSSERCSICVSLSNCNPCQDVVIFIPFTTESLLWLHFLKVINTISILCS